MNMGRMSRVRLSSVVVGQQQIVTKVKPSLKGYAEAVFFKYLNFIDCGFKLSSH